MVNRHIRARTGECDSRRQQRIGLAVAEVGVEQTKECDLFTLVLQLSCRRHRDNSTH
jgi:hypothetical protein